MIKHIDMICYEFVLIFICTRKDTDVLSQFRSRFLSEIGHGQMIFNECILINISKNLYDSNFFNKKDKEG